ncbi:MAG TPA: EthD family reductase [Anaerolineae bacterium]|nr:EthD family reductase [Anaerolineae bacterium]
MIKLIALYKKPADVDAFEEHYANVHVRLVEKIPGLRKTEWARLLAAPDGAAPYYMMYEMYFDSMDAYQAAMRSEENKAAGQDLMSFAGGLVTLMLAEAYEDEVRSMNNAQ